MTPRRSPIDLEIVLVLSETVLVLSEIALVLSETVLVSIGRNIRVQVPPAAEYEYEYENAGFLQREVSFFLPIPAATPNNFA